MNVKEGRKGKERRNGGKRDAGTQEGWLFGKSILRYTCRFIAV